MSKLVNVLHVRASPRDEAHGSLSRKLGNAFFSKLNAEAAAKGTEVVTVIRDLTSFQLPHLTQEYAEKGFAFAPAMDISSELSNELKAADIVVLETPVHNWAPPAALKLWYDLTLTVGVAFEYTADGPRGMLGDKKFIVLQASGGTPVDAPNNFFSQHLDFLVGSVCGGDIVANIGVTGKAAEDDFAAADKSFDDVLDKLL
ncbi:MAG: hypothetical protein MHM6MM_006730 [Cercozoa sp. M6MM]